MIDEKRKYNQRDVDKRITSTDDLYFLKKFSDYFEDHTNGIRIKYSIINSTIEGLDEFIPNQFFLNNDQSFRTMVKTMTWIHNFLIPDGDVSPIHPFNCLNILRLTKEKRIRSNCWMYATVLNEVLLGLGYKSKMIRCLPLDLRFNDCHCVVHAFVPEYKKWVMFDPAFCSYVTDCNRVPLNLGEIRSSIIREEKLITPITPHRMSEKLRSYYIKNLFRFESYDISEFNYEEIQTKQTIYSLIPKGYELSDKEFTEGSKICKILHTHNEKEFWKV